MNSSCYSGLGLALGLLTLLTLEWCGCCTEVQGAEITPAGHCSALNVSFYDAPKRPALSVSFYEVKRKPASAPKVVSTPVELPARKIRSPLATRPAETRPTAVYEDHRQQRLGWRLRRLFGGRRR